MISVAQIFVQLVQHSCRLVFAYSESGRFVQKSCGFADNFFKNSLFLRKNRFLLACISAPEISFARAFLFLPPQFYAFLSPFIGGIIFCRAIRNGRCFRLAFRYEGFDLTASSASAMILVYDNFTIVHRSHTSFIRINYNCRLLSIRNDTTMQVRRMFLPWQRNSIPFAIRFGFFTNRA